MNRNDLATRGATTFIVAASAAMLAAARNRALVPARARILNFVGIETTIAANAAYGSPQGAAEQKRTPVLSPPSGPGFSH